MLDSLLIFWLYDVSKVALYLDASVTGIGNAVTFTVLTARAIACSRRKVKLGSALEGKCVPRFNMAMYKSLYMPKEELGHGGSHEADERLTRE
jgi:hypothetical protein